VLRSLDSPDVWMPTVEGSSPEGTVVGLLAHPAELRGRGRIRAQIGPAPGDQAPAAPDVVGLLRFVRSELTNRRSGFDPEALYAAEVREEIWRSAEERLEPTGDRLAATLSDDDSTHIEMTILRTGAGDFVTAIEDRGINVLLAPTATALAESVGRLLEKSGFLRFAQEIEIHRATPPRAERLEPDDIWTHETEEVNTAWT